MTTAKQITPKTTQVTCPRCNGKGHFVEYSGIWGGTCFKCEGRGTVTVRVLSEAAKARKAARVAAAAADHAARVAKGNIKAAKAVEMYRNDPRLRVGSDHAWFSAHCIELAQKDRAWESL